MLYPVRYPLMSDGRISWWLLMLLMLCHLLATLAALALQPIAYAMVGKLASADEVSRAMYGWYFGVSVSYDLAGRIADMAATRGGIGDYRRRLRVAVRR